MEKIHNNADVYKAVRYLDFCNIRFLDEHTVMITEDVIFQSVRGYLVTDGQKSYSNGICKIPGSGFDGQQIDIHKGSENIYSWNGGY